MYTNYDMVRLAHTQASASTKFYIAYLHLKLVEACDG